MCTKWCYEYTVDSTCVYAIHLQVLVGTCNCGSVVLHNSVEVESELGTVYLDS